MVEKINNIKKAFELGYRVNSDGEVTGIRKKYLSLNTNTSRYPLKVQFHL